MTWDRSYCESKGLEGSESCIILPYKAKTV